MIFFSLWNRDAVTSAPSVREVDEYHQDLTAAEKRKKTAEKLKNQKITAGPKDKLILKGRQKDEVSLNYVERNS